MAGTGFSPVGGWMLRIMLLRKVGWNIRLPYKPQYEKLMRRRELLLIKLTLFIWRIGLRRRVRRAVFAPGFFFVHYGNQ